MCKYNNPSHYNPWDKKFSTRFFSKSKTITEILLYKLDGGYCEVFDQGNRGSYYNFKV
jgi:hypothetical protein